jgi:hypothetical protein
LADTLEGYPDLFVSALIGESLSGGISSAATTHSINTSARHEHMHYPTLRQPDMLTSSEHRNLMLFERRGDDDISPGGVDGTNAATPPSTDHATSPRHSEHWQHYPSYGRLSEADMDPNTYLAQSAEAESRKESLCMMLGFSLFAVIPSLIYTWVPAILFGSHDAAGIHVNPSSQHVAAFVNPNTGRMEVALFGQQLAHVWH